MGTERRRLTALVALVLGLAGGGAARAHSGQVTRALALEPAGERLEVLVHLEIGGRARRQSLFALADADRDGRLSAAEEKRLETQLAARALDGLEVELDGRRVVLEQLDAKLALSAEGPTALMLHGTAALPATARALTVKTGVLGDPLTVVLVEGTRTLAAPPRGRRVADRVQAAMGVNDRLTFRLGDVRSPSR
jgi:hypothetical protein